jgi:hypothetical protein
MATSPPKQEDPANGQQAMECYQNSLWWSSWLLWKKCRYLRQHHLDTRNKARRLSQVISEQKKGNILPDEVSLLNVWCLIYLQPCNQLTWSFWCSSINAGLMHNCIDCGSTYLRRWRLLVTFTVNAREESRGCKNVRRQKTSVVYLMLQWKLLNPSSKLRYWLLNTRTISSNKPTRLLPMY